MRCWISQGVGKLVESATKLGKKSSVAFCYKVGMDYVSCSPYRVPIARLAAAQAALSDDKAEAMRTA